MEHILGSIPTSVFLDKTVGIVIVEPTMSIASTIRRVFLESDYSNVYIAHSVLDAINTIGNNNINWVITSPLTEERLNQWHLLRIPLEVAAYSNIMVSVLVNPDNVALTEEYYAFGALSVHSRQLTYNTFQEEINALQLRLKSHANVEQAIAEDLRGTFNSVKDVQKLENLEETLLATIDTTPAQRMRTIEARFKAKSNLEAMMEIRDLFSKHPELANDLKILSQAYLGTSDIQTFRGPLPVKKVLILDPDVSQQQFLRGVFTELGAEVIVCCDTIDAACNSLHDDEIYDVIVTEWKLHDVKGHAFIQHVRHHGHERQPVFIHSSLVKPEDHALIGEIGGVFIITKPTSKEKIKRFLTETIERWNFPQEGEDQGEKILNVLNAGRLAEALSINQSFQKNSKIDKKLKDFVSATIAFHEGRYQEAKDLILKNAKTSVPGHKEISLLGKLLLKLGDPGAALKFLEQANQMVPGNIDRLCQLADVNAEVGKPEKALAVANEARKIGGDIELVQSTFAKHSVALGQFDEASEYLESEDTARDMIGFMNNLGIAHAAGLKWKESEKSYRDALKALEGRHPHLQAIVSYNLGLSLARQNRLPEADKILKEAETHGEASIKRKSQDLKERVEKAIQTKQPLVLKEAIKEISAPRVSQVKSSIDEYMLKTKVKIHGLFGVVKPRGTIPGIDLISELPKNVMRKDKDHEET